MKIWKILTACLMLVAGNAAMAQRGYSYSVQKIWDNDTYDAFTSLLKYNGRLYCAFREGRGHVFDENGKAEGKIRILSSKDGKLWRTEWLYGEKGRDFRDPKLCITPDGKMMVTIGVSIYVNKELKEQLPYVCFSSDGKSFSKPERCKVEGQDDHVQDWIWRVTWYDGVGYGVDYFKTKAGEVGLWLLTTTDGRNYQRRCALDVPDFPNEATIRFLSDGRMAMMVRRDAGDCMGYWAVSSAPYTAWTWKKMPMRLGGPDFVMLDDNRVLCVSRCHHIPYHCTTAIYEGDATTGRFHQLYVLPSGGDTSYAGIVKDGKNLWISYYAGHETHWPSIYLAKMPLMMFNP